MQTENLVDLHMNTPNITNEQMQFLLHQFQSNLLMDVSLARYTTARVGGRAKAFIEATSADQLAEIVAIVWSAGIPYKIIGGGSNILIGDRDISRLVILNRAKYGKGLEFIVNEPQPMVKVESGINLNTLVRKSSELGYSGLEWAVGIPGTVGGAVYGNAGAHGSDIASILLMADILQHPVVSPDSKAERLQWTSEDFYYRYRSSRLKQNQGNYVVLAVLLQLRASTPYAVKRVMDEFNATRQKKQPIGASIGSMFKNPSGDYAGRLIEAAGLKGTRIGNAEISKQHGNFFINLGEAKADDIYQLILTAQKAVLEKFGVKLELEIELLGNYFTEQASS